MRRITSKAAVLLVPLAIAAAVTGCGGDDNDNATTSTSTTATTPTDTSTSTTPAAGKGETLKLSADAGGALKFDKSDLEAKAGEVTLVMDNPSSVPHAVAVEGNGVDKDGKTVGKGGVSKVTVDLKPGKYDFYCPVPGHEEAGMKGDLTVK